MEQLLEFPTRTTKEEIPDIAFMPHEFAGRLGALANSIYSHFGKTRFQSASDILATIDAILKQIKEQQDDFDYFNAYK